MDNTLYCNEQFVFHASWIKAMRHIKSPSVRNRLIAAILEYGLNRVYTPIGNPVADAILTLVIDQIDRESPRVGEKSAGTVSTQDSECPAPTDMDDWSRYDEDVKEGGESLSLKERSCSPLCDRQEADTLHEDASSCADGNFSQRDNSNKNRRESKSRKKKRRARRRKHRR